MPVIFKQGGAEDYRPSINLKDLLLPHIHIHITGLATPSLTELHNEAATHWTPHINKHLESTVLRVQLQDADMQKDSAIKP